MQYEIARYKEEQASVWDTFLDETVNGTFLQSRRFLSYHPVGRFEDCSLMIYDAKGNLAGLCPGAAQVRDGKRIFVSHPGSTFGGLLVPPKHYKAEKILAMLEALEGAWAGEGFEAADLRITPSIFAQQADDLMEYALVYRGWREDVELNLSIDYDNYREPVEFNFSQGKRSECHKAKRLGMYGRPLASREELVSFYEILCKNLAKYDASPVHTIEELQDFAEARLQNECEFFGVFLPQATGERMLAGGMMFYFDSVHVAHTQYLAAVTDYASYSPMTFLCAYLIETMRKRGYKRMTFGISTEQRGKVLNRGLTSSKEAFGSRHSVNRKFWKDL